MSESAVLWMGLTTAIGGVSAARTLRTYLNTTEFDYWAFTVTCLCVGGIVELGTANDYLPATTPLAVVSVLCSVVALLSGGAALRNRRKS
jgi:hypothetical protein